MSSGNQIDLDIAIIGGGSAGISLASQLDGPNTRVFEPCTPAERDVSWSLWATEAQMTELAPAIVGSWDQWRIVDSQSEVIHQTAEYRYTSLSSAQYLSYCEGRLADSVQLVRASAENITAQGAGGCFTASGQQYRAKKIYDNRPPTMAQNGLIQHFLGVEIHTKNPITEPEIATLMDFRVDQSRGLHFIYMLPFADNRLLIESTMISTSVEDKQWYLQAIKQWLDEQGIEIEKLLREEMGVIPMHRVTPQNPDLDTIGSASGAVRQSSGYAFSAIQAQMKALAKGIAAGELDVPAPIPVSLMRMDKIFNAVLLARPDLRVSIFMGTAKALSGDGFARFMLGSASLMDWAKVILAMPKLPFIKAVFCRD